MWSVRTASRLHLGLLSLPADESARRFGGVGLMINAPGVNVRVEPAASWSARGPLAARALSVAERLAASFDGDLPPRHLIIETASAEHAGLGTGTQLALAVARSLSLSWGRDDDTPSLAARVGRGQRSALGVHGFDRGGLLVEAGKHGTQALSPLVARLEFPAAWRVLVVLPPGSEGRHGAAEREAFARLVEPSGASAALCRLVLMGVLPALVESDLSAFGEAVHEFNARSGELFAPVQGGIYAGTAVADAVRRLQASGAVGVGQSSWGPGAFGFFADDDRAQHAAAQVRRWPGFADAQAFVAAGCNRGACFDTPA